MEIRLHGRGGQGGVTCAKVLAVLYARLGMHVQTFGDYAGERSGAPVRAYLRVADGPIHNRNKVHRPDHVLVLDPSLLGAEVVAGLAPGGTVLVNTPEAPEALAARFPRFRACTVDATAIARRHGIGTRSVVIVNTTLGGAYARALGLPLEDLAEVYRDLGYEGDLAAAREAHEAARLCGPDGAGRSEATAEAPASAAGRAVLSLVAHVESPPTGLRTGAWRTSSPRYVRRRAPCSAACPAGNDVVGFVQTLAREGEAAARAVLARTTPLPATCGRVCPAPCMAACNRAPLDGAVGVRLLERWVADRTPGSRPEVETCRRPARLAVVGSGPAGLSAAHALALRGHRVVLLEREAAPGGALRTGIPAYRLPRRVLDEEVAGVLDLGVELRTGVDCSGTRLEGLAGDFDAIVLATGLQRPTVLEVPGRGLAGVRQGLEFLAAAQGGRAGGLGHVVVLGGGNTAIDCARSALRLGAEGVTLAYRRTREEMPAIPAEVDAALAEGVDLRLQRQPVGFEGDGRLRAVDLAEVEMGPPGPDGRRAPAVTSRRQRIPCDTVLLALGQAADRSVLPSGWELRDSRAWRQGRPLAVHAAGDLRTGDGTVAAAIGDGRRSALRALEALGLAAAAAPEPCGGASGSEVPVGPSELRLGSFRRAAPARERLASWTGRPGDFDEVERGLEDGGEAGRCLSCGTCTRCDTCLVYCPEGVIERTATGYRVDLDYCKGCGVCVAECPRAAMEMVAG